MPEYVVPRDSESIVYDYLTTAPLPGVSGPVHTALPETLPASFTQIMLDGGRRANRVTDEGTVTIRAWGGDKKSSLDLCKAAYAALLALPEDSTHGVYVRRVVSIGGPAYLPDPETNRHRYQATVQLDIRPALVA